MQVLLNILCDYSLTLLVGISLLIIYYPTKFLNITHAAIITLGAYFTYLFFHDFNLPLAFAIGLSIVFAVMVGTVCEICVFRFLRNKKALPSESLVVSIGLYIILQSLISLYFGDNPRTIHIRDISTGYYFFCGYLTSIQIVTIVTSFLLSILFCFLLLRTNIGKSIRAVSSDSWLCNIHGINSNKVILFSFVVGSAVAAVAGLLSALDVNMTPTFGFNMLLNGTVALIVGGIGSLRGLFAGALLLIITQHLTGYYIGSKWMNAITCIILIVFLIWKPLGLSGKKIKKVEL